MKPIQILILNHRNIARFTSVLIVASVVPFFLQAQQISVSGLDCVIAGGTNGYLYNASGPLQQSDKVTWKVTGGTIVATSSDALTGTTDTSSSIRVVWSNKNTTGTVQLTNGKLGTYTFNVRINSIPNDLPEGDKKVKKGTGVSLKGAAFSGSCAAHYDFWWESASAPDGPYNDVDGGKSPDIDISSVTQKTYYRRVFAVNGNLIYSNVIMVDVQ